MRASPASAPPARDTGAASEEDRFRTGWNPCIPDGNHAENAASFDGAPGCAPASGAPVIARQVVVIGAGPAGLAAAGELVAAGARVLLVEERSQLGGRAMIVPGARGLTEGLMRGLGSAEVWRNSPAVMLSGREAVVLRGHRLETVAGEAVILATGAREAALPFPGWTLEGVLSVEMAWEAIRRGRVAADSGPAVVVGSGEAGPLAARLAERGVAVTLAAARRPPGVPEAIPLAAAAVSAAEGDRTLERVLLSDGTGIACRLLCVESPRAPATELPRLAGCPCRYEPLLGGFVPRYDPTLALHGPADRLYAAGDAAGVDTPRAAAESGRLAARCALRALGLLQDAEEKIADARRRLAAASTPLHARARDALMVGAPAVEVIESWDGPDGVIVCPCRGVTVGDLKAALDEGAVTADDLARWTRCGTGECRWRRCGGVVLRWLSGALGTPIGRLPLPRLSPPVSAVPLTALAGTAAPAAPGPAPDASGRPSGHA